MVADTNALFFWVEGGHRLTAAARAALERSGQPLLSVVSLFELTTKQRIGKLTMPTASAGEIVDLAVQEGFELLPLDAQVAARAGALVGPHKDPFDRLIIAQALVRGLPVVTSDAIFEAYGVRRIW